MRKVQTALCAWFDGGRASGYHAFALDRVGADHEHLTGRRTVLLALARQKGFAVPPGFVVLRKTFADLVRDSQLKLLFPSIEKRLVGRTTPMEQLAVEIRELVKVTPVPRHIMLDIEGGSQALGLGNRALGKAVTVRACPVDERLSSAPLERAVAVTRLSDLEPHLKTCWASAFDALNLEAIRHYGIPIEDAAPAVLVSETVPAEVSGLLFSHAPGEADALLLEAVWGFHEALSEGKFAASRYFVNRQKPGEVRAEESEQKWEYAQGPQGAMVRREVPPERAARPKLSKLQIDELVRAVVELEKLVGGPIGVEWAIHAGVVFVLQVVPLAAGEPPPSEAESAERYIASVAATEGSARSAAQAVVAPPPRRAEPRPAPPPAMSAPPVPASPPLRRLKLLPVIQSSLYVEMPPGARPADAAGIPHAGLVIDLGKWVRKESDGPMIVRDLAVAAAAVFPRPVLVELSDLDPAAYEAMSEQAMAGVELDEPALRRMAGPTLDELHLIAQAADEVGATNLHVIAPLIRTGGDARVVRAALAAAGLEREDAPPTLLFSELRNPADILNDERLAEAQDGIIVRASRFYNALMREGGGALGSQDQGASSGVEGPMAKPFVRALFQATRAFDRSGGTVLVLLEEKGDFDMIWFFREIGVDGFITRLADAEACTAALAESERRQGARAPRRGMLR